MRIIYADILIVINLAVDYLVLFGTARLAGTQFLRLRALVAAAIGAGYSLCVLFPLPQWVLWLSRLAVSVAMVLICFGKRKVCELIRLLAIFYLCGFVCSGFMLLVSLVEQPNAFLLKNGVVYFELSEPQHWRKRSGEARRHHGEVLPTKKGRAPGSSRMRGPPPIL